MNESYVKVNKKKCLFDDFCHRSKIFIDILHSQIVKETTSQLHKHYKRLFLIYSLFVTFLKNKI